MHARPDSYRPIRTRAATRLLHGLTAFALFPCSAIAEPRPAAEIPEQFQDERPDDPYVNLAVHQRATRAPFLVEQSGWVSRQVNVDASGQDIVGDAANEPSIAVDPNDPRRVVIGWRQFDSVESNFRQAGWGVSDDGGRTWTTGVLEPGAFRSDPVLDVDAAGTFYYNSLTQPDSGYQTHVFRSTDGGLTWPTKTFAFGGDKQWMAIDRSDGAGAGNLYQTWSRPFAHVPGTGLNRSVDGGESFEDPIPVPRPLRRGTTVVAPSGTVYVAAEALGEIVVLRSRTLGEPGSPPTFDLEVTVDLGGVPRTFAGPNPGGFLGQVWVAASRAPGQVEDTVYVLAGVDPPGPDPYDIHFTRSTDSGATWSAPVRLNDDAPGAWQWFGTLAVAPNGRIDAVWADGRDDPEGFDSRLVYTSSVDGGVTWSSNIALSPPFDPHLGWPRQAKLGDYYDMVSEDDIVHVAWAATFGGEQNVYYLALDPPSPARLLLRQRRFSIDVEWRTSDGMSGQGQAVQLTEDTGYFWFFDPDNAEVLIKVLDACADPWRKFWVFSSALSNLEYDLRVTDRQTRQVYTLHNPQGLTGAAVLQTGSIFTECGDGDGTGLPAVQHVDTGALPPSPPPAIRETVDSTQVGPCQADDRTICLQGGRFRVRASWRDVSGSGGDATMTSLTADSGYGTFFGDTNVELFLKILDACELAPFHRFWPIVTGLTDVEVALEITDTSTGKVYRIDNPAGQVFPTVLDTTSFFDDCS